VEALNVEPPVPFEVEDFAVGLVDLSVAVGPNACFVEFQQWMHASPKKVRVKFTLQEILNCQYGFLHFFLKLNWSLEGSVGLEFHDVQLKLFAKGEVWLFNEVDNSAMKILYDFVDDRQCLKLVIHY